MGVVYLARRAVANRPVALKTVLAGDLAGESERGRLRAEAEAIARLNHPNIVQIYEVGEYRGVPFFSLEFCPGGSLARYVAGNPMRAAAAARLVAQLAGAVGYPPFDPGQEVDPFGRRPTGVRVREGPPVAGRNAPKMYPLPRRP
jgi:serine/threonine-protein kinase